MYDFKFADIGEGIHEGTVLKWNFKVGDKVNEGDVLVVVETDKVNAELPAPVSGTILKLGPNEGETIHVGQTVAVIGEAGAEVTQTTQVKAPEVMAKPTEVEQPVAQVTPPVAKKSDASGYNFKFADIGEGIHEGTVLKWNFKVGDKVNEGDVLVVVETDKVNAELPAPVAGTILKLGPNEGETIHVGQTVAIIGEAGAQAVVSAPKEQEEEKAAGVVGAIEVSSDVIASSNEVSEHQQTTTQTKALATPVARLLAKELGVDINSIKGTGEQGRVLKEDIIAASNKVSTPAQTVTQVTTPQQPAPVAPVAAPVKPEGDVEVVKISRLRKAIAKSMTQSKAIIPHTVLVDEFNVNALVDFRNKAKDVALAKGIKLTYMALIMKAVIVALKEFPIFNASFNHETDEVYIKKTINLGMAVDTPDGLIVPNIKNAGSLSVFELATQVRKLADDTIARKVGLDQLSNGTFTITNFGSVGVSFGTPVINYPELAILGVGKIEQKPIVENNEIKIASMLPLSLAVDHRIIDGADGGRFLMRVKELLNNPTLLLLS